MKKENISGNLKKIFYDPKISRLNLELVKVEGEYYEIHFQDWTEENKNEDILILHIKEAIELKGIIDMLVIDMIQGVLNKDE